MPRRAIQPQVDPEEEDLQRLLQIAQLHGLLTKPALESQQLQQTDDATKLTAAIHLLGLQRQSQNDAATLKETARYHTGELEHLNAATDAAIKERDAANRTNLISDVMRDPSVPWSDKQQYLSTDPMLADVHQRLHAKAVADATPKMLAAVSALYGDSKTRSDPQKLGVALNAVRSQAPDAFDSLDWNSLNQSLAPKASDGTSFGSKAANVAKLSMAINAVGLPTFLGSAAYNAVANDPNNKMRKEAVDFWNGLTK